jgi:hypothetical protein
MPSTGGRDERTKEIDFVFQLLYLDILFGSMLFKSRNARIDNITT